VSLKSGLGVTNSVNWCTTCTCWIYRPETIFLPLTVIGLCSFTSTQRAFRKLHGVKWCVVVIQAHRKWHQS